MAEVERKKGGVREESERTGKPERRAPWAASGPGPACWLWQGAAVGGLLWMLPCPNRTAAQLTASQRRSRFSHLLLWILTHLTAVVLKEAEERVEIYG